MLYKLLKAVPRAELEKEKEKTKYWKIKHDEQLQQHQNTILAKDKKIEILEEALNNYDLAGLSWTENKTPRKSSKPRNKKKF